MAIRVVFAVLLIFMALLVSFKKYFVLILAIGVIVFVLIVLIRLGADLFWWGKDKNKW